MGYRVKLDVFEGPFDLMVYLIEHAQMSIYDIRISEITDQYMEYVGSMQEADVNVYSEFMVLAAALLEIKSKMLLPRSVPERWESASLHLEKPQEDLAEYTGEPDEYLSLDIEQFIAAFEKFLNRKKKLEEIKAHHRRSEKQRITNETRMNDIRDFFVESGLKQADFMELVPEKNDRYDTAVTFSSVLEMMKQRRLDAQQQYIFGDITVTATDELFEEDKENGDGR